MIGQLAFLFLGTWLGIALNWVRASYRKPTASGRTVAEIRNRIEREHRGRHWRPA